MKTFHISSAIMFKIITIISFFAFIPLSAIAQFQDSDSEVRIYAEDSWLNNPSGYPNFLVINFNGNKAAIIAVSGGAPGRPSGAYKFKYQDVLNDDYALEKRIFAKDILLMDYNSENSTSSKKCYTAKKSANVYDGSMWGRYETYTENYVFSSDGNRIIELYGSNFPNGKYKGVTYKKISKDKLIELLLKYENKKNTNNWR